MESKLKYLYSFVHRVGRMGNAFLWRLISQSPHASISTAGIQATVSAWISKTDPRLHAVRRLWPGGSRLLSRWQWGSPGVWVWREVVSGRCHKLGSRVCIPRQVWCLRQYKIPEVLGEQQDEQILNLLPQSCNNLEFKDNKICYQQCTWVVWCDVWVRSQTFRSRPQRQRFFKSAPAIRPLPGSICAQ